MKAIRKKFNDLRARTLRLNALDEPMAFEFDGRVYRLQFQRFQDSGFSKPSTTVSLEEFVVWRDDKGRVTSHGWIVNRTATVGCYHRDNFSKEDGRRAAITAMCKGYGANSPSYTQRETWRAFRRAIWDAYFERYRP